MQCVSASQCVSLSKYGTLCVVHIFSTQRWKDESCSYAYTLKFVEHNAGVCFEVEDHKEVLLDETFR